MNLASATSISLLALSAALHSATAQPSPKPMNSSDAFLEQYAATRRFAAGRPASITLTPEGSAVLFLRSGPRSFEQNLYEIDAATGQERVLLTVDKVLAGQKEQLSKEELARRERARISSRGITHFDLSDDGKQLLVPLSGRLFVVDRASGSSREIKGAPGFPIDPSLSPDGAALACVRDGDLYVTSLTGPSSGSEKRLTTGATDHITHGLSEFVAQEEMGRSHGYWWSPDGAAIAYETSDTTGVEMFHIADPTDPSKTASEWPYPRPGKPNANVNLALISTRGGPSTQVSWDHDTYPYLARVTWSKNAPLTLLVQNRAQTEQLLLAVDTATGSTTTLLKETDPAWINLEPANPTWLADGQSFLWMTEGGKPGGEWQLELRSRKGDLIRTLTQKGFGLHGLIAADESTGVVYVAASPEPTQSHIFRVPLDGHNKPVALTSSQAHYSATFSHAPDATRKIYVQSSHTLDGDIATRVMHIDGSSPHDIKSVAEEPPFKAKVELTTVTPTWGDPGRTFCAALIRPANFDASKKYPVLAMVYAGPSTQTVSTAGRGYLLNQWFANRGFVVVSLDCRGTPGRGRDWERVIKEKKGHGDLIDVELTDICDGLKALGQKYPEMDLTRVGVSGWSFGGYFSAMAAMRRPDVFKAAVAGAPVTDWADYDTHYTERYMGTPQDNSQGYKDSSVLTYAKDLRVPLLLIHGTADDNVYFMHSLKLTEALFRAGKPFEFLPLAGFTHMVPDPLVTIRLENRIAEFFEHHLNAASQ